MSLNDYSVTVEPETSQALGFGYRLGFLGLLHLEVFSQRLEDEYSAEVLVTTPSVPYKVFVLMPILMCVVRMQGVWDASPVSPTNIY